MFMPKYPEPMNVALYDKKNFSNVIKDLETGDYSGLSSGPSVITIVLKRGPQEESESEKALG